MSDGPNYKRLRTIQIAALAAGAVVLIVLLWLTGQFRKPELAPIVMAFALALITFCGVFYFGALRTEGWLEKYLFHDETFVHFEGFHITIHKTDTGIAAPNEPVGMGLKIESPEVTRSV